MRTPVSRTKIPIWVAEGLAWISLWPLLIAGFLLSGRIAKKRWVWIAMVFNGALIDVAMPLLAEMLHPYMTWVQIFRLVAFFHVLGGFMVLVTMRQDPDSTPNGTALGAVVWTAKRIGWWFWFAFCLGTSRVKKGERARVFAILAGGIIGAGIFPLNRMLDPSAPWTPVFVIAGTIYLVLGLIAVEFVERNDERLLARA